MKTLPLAALTAAILAATPLAWSQPAAKLKVGLMLPATGTYAALGTAIENGFKLYVDEQGGKLGGREIEYVNVDDESDPSKATDNINKLDQARQRGCTWSGRCIRVWPWPWPKSPRTAALC